MKPSRFTIQTLLVLTAAFAMGWSFRFWTGGGLVEWCLGGLTTFVAVGLVQQAVAQGQPLARRLALLLLLGCLAWGAFRACRPYSVLTTNWEGIQEVVEVESLAARSLWILSLVFGSLTSHGLLTDGSSRTTSRRWFRFLVGALVIAGLICYIVYLAHQWAFIPSLVDIAVHGVQLGHFQGPAVGTSQYVEWVGRTPEEFRTFVTLQTASWPLLIVALLLAIVVSQQTRTSKRWFIVANTVVVVLATPAIVNGVWLLNGGLRQIFPLFVDTYWADPRPELILFAPTLLLLTLYFTTRRSKAIPSETEEPMPQAVAGDSVVVGGLFTAIGATELYQIIREPWWMDGRFEDMEWSEIIRSIPSFVGDLLSYPEYAYPVLLLPYGVSWLWFRFRARNRKLQRWPHFGTRQQLCFPLILALLTLFVVLNLPFGIAILHFNV
ncbi:MAG: hypothetical protein AAFU85_24360 [Planctomycetota bacterium]